MGEETSRKKPGYREEGGGMIPLDSVRSGTDKNKKLELRNNRLPLYPLGSVPDRVYLNQLEARSRVNIANQGLRFFFFFFSVPDDSSYLLNRRCICLSTCFLAAFSLLLKSYFIERAGVCCCLFTFRAADFIKH